MKSFPWNSINRDRLYDANEFRDIFKYLYHDGIFPFDSTCFQVYSKSGMILTIKKGVALLLGTMAKEEVDVDITIDAAHSTLSRIDRIVVRRTESLRRCEIKVIKGVNASNPIAPSIVRNADIYDLCLAEVYVMAGITEIKQLNITDTRLNNDLCGVITGAVESIDTSTLLIQMYSWFDGAKADFTTYVNSIKDILSKVDPGGVLLAEITAAREGAKTIVENLQTYVKKNDYGLGGIAPTYNNTLHLYKTGIYARNYGGEDTIVSNFYNGKRAVFSGNYVNKDRQFYISGISPYPIINVLDEKNNLTLSIDKANDYEGGGVDCVLEHANGIKEIMLWISVPPVSQGAGYGGRYYELPAEFANIYSRVINVQSTAVRGQCSSQCWHTVISGKKCVAITYSNTSEPLPVFNVRMVVKA